MLRNGDKGKARGKSSYACKILKKKENPLSSMPEFTKMKLQALIATGQTLGVAIYKTL